MLGLLDMPPEILHLVYDWLRRIEHGPVPACTWAPISPALLPYTQAYRYHTVVIAKPDAWRKFAATIAGSARLGGAVRHVVCLAEYGDGAEVGGVGGVEVGMGELAGMWRNMRGLQSVSMKGSALELDSLKLAIERGLSLSALDSVEITLTNNSWDNPYLLDNWRPILDAAPKLTSLSIEYDHDYAAAPDDSPALPVVPSAGFATCALTSLDVLDAPAAHEPALAHFINSFPRLTSLHLDFTTDALQPSMLALLEVAGLRKLGYSWLANDEDEAVPLPSLDLRRFPALQEVTFTSKHCAPTFQFLLPPTVRTLSICMLNCVPLAALSALITPSSPAHLPSLQHINLDLPFATNRSENLELLGLEEMCALQIEEEDVMDWTEEVSPEGLEALIGAAKEFGVRLTGTCRVALEFHMVYEVQEVARMRAMGGGEDEEGEEDEEEGSEEEGGDSADDGSEQA